MRFLRLRNTSSSLRHIFVLQGFAGDFVVFMLCSVGFRYVCCEDLRCMGTSSGIFRYSTFQAF